MGDEPSVGSSNSSTMKRKKEEKDFYFGRIIGEGSFSQVYLAKEVKTNGKEVAIKVCKKAHIIKEKKTEAIMREKEVMLRITDPANWSPTAPFFVKLLATFHTAGSLYFVLSLAKQGDMFRFIKKMAAREVDVTQFYAGELVQALEHLHSLGIVHRDLKPENILLSSSMHILLTDFGSAKILAHPTHPASPPPTTTPAPETEEGEDQPDGCDPASASAKPKRHSFVGTAQYVSPEVLTNDGASPASDLWALGCILYQMVTGLPPFVGQSEYLIFQKIQALQYSFYEGFDPLASDLVEKLLVIDPLKRLGAGDTAGGYPSIKQHPFFEGLDFPRLHLAVPPSVERYVGDPARLDPVWARCGEGLSPGLTAEAMNRMLRDQMEAGSTEQGDRTEDSDSGGEGLLGSDEDSESVVSVSSDFINNTGNIGDITDQERQRLLQSQRETNEYHRFVEGKLILKQGILDKKKGLWSRRRMFLLTEGPRLFYVDPREKVLKGEIPFSADMKCEMKDFRIFFVHTPARVYYLIDPASFATKWCEAIERVRAFYFPPSSSQNT